MKREYLPYYISRAILSILFSILVFGLDWKALILSAVFFGLFLLYLHSGWFSVDSKNPLFPLRRDSRGILIQRKALIISIIAGLLAYFTLNYVSTDFDLTLVSGSVAFAVAVLAYFASQFFLFIKA